MSFQDENPMSTLENGNPVVREAQSQQDYNPLAKQKAAAKLSRTPTRVRSDAPELGEHSQEILAELGYDDARIRALTESGVVGGS